MGWIGVDLDHTLATYEAGSARLGQIGKPVPRMVRRVRRWLASGREVRIMTARVNKVPGWDHKAQRKLVEAWTVQVFVQKLQVTNEKDFDMIMLFDDRAVGVEPDTGRLLSPMPFNLRKMKEFEKKNR